MKKRPRLTWLCAFSLVVTTTWSASSLAQAMSKVATAQVTKQHTIQQLKIPASVNARNNSAMSFGVSGRLAEFQYEVGDRVDRGTVIAQLDKRQVSAAIESLQAERDALTATLQDEQQQLAELESLAATDFAAQSELRRARAAVNVAQAQLAEVTARLNERRVALEYHQLTAPFNAIIAERRVNVGEWVNQDQVAFRLVQNDKLHVDAYLSQRFLSQLNEDTQVSISRQQAPNDSSIEATITRQVNVVNGNDRTFLVRLEPTGEHNLVPGAAVTAHFDIRSRTPQLTVPQDAVIRYSDGRTSVWTVTTEQGKTIVRERLVELGQRFSGWVAVNDVLTENDSVVVRGNEALTDGQQVQAELSEDYD